MVENKNLKLYKNQRKKSKKIMPTGLQISSKYNWLAGTDGVILYDDIED